MLEIIAHLNPVFIPAFHLLVLEIPNEYRAVLLADLPVNWQEETPGEPLQSHLAGWLSQPDVMTVSVPSAIVNRSRNYLLHTLHPAFQTNVRIVENNPFAIDMRLMS